ncbi:hypothetical protein BCV70DRAFT_198975 [Testicularia cyperi]|uniref:Uncharacterized protein n=1 Tax=Testicularia cyperi TaxID=1882483 RepID=A0A317XT56_9BASI|nr:hypothetical protein BCV70DRAFT_198975 [Testicularia cyperi]
MAFVANKITKRLVSTHAKQYEPEDPLYEFYTDVNGKQKRRKRPLPPGLTKAEARLLKKIKKRAHYLDKGFYICGFRFGWTFFIGLIPGLGDATDAALNYTLVVRPVKKELADRPDWLVRQMMFNNAVSAGVGLVPLVGDIALAVWKANSRNAKLLEELLRVRGEENLANGLQGLTPYPEGYPHPAQDAAHSQAKKNVSGIQGQTSTAGSASNAASASRTTPPNQNPGSAHSHPQTPLLADTDTHPHPESRPAASNATPQKSRRWFKK